MQSQNSRSCFCMSAVLFHGKCLGDTIVDTILLFKLNELLLTITT
jgi:hypothetical protein